jgi:nitrogen regulatory protein P-II 1
MKQRGEAKPQELKYMADSMVDKVVENILSSSSTGLAGEGKMFVSDVDDAVDIGSKTRGEAAV